MGHVVKLIVKGAILLQARLASFEYRTRTAYSGD